MSDIILFAPARFDRPVLYDVEVTIEEHFLTPSERRQTIRGALAACPVDMVLSGTRGEAVDHELGVSLCREYPCRPWSWNNQ